MRNNSTVRYACGCAEFMGVTRPNGETVKDVHCDLYDTREMKDMLTADGVTTKRYKCDLLNAREDFTDVDRLSREAWAKKQKEKKKAIKDGQGLT